MADSAPATAGPSNLRLRVISALALAAVALSATWVGGPVFTVTWIAAAACVLVEWLRLTGAHTRPAALAGAVGLAMIGFAAPSVLIDGSGRPPAAVTAGIALVGGAAAVYALGGPSARLWGALGFLYAAVLAFVPPYLRADPVEGLLSILLLYGVVWGTDIGAYFTGRALGGPKLWPRLSPKKTWSGLIGGVVAGVCLAWLFYLVHGLIGPASVLPDAESGWGWRLTLFLAVCAVISQGGDLLESALKRKFDVKDASQLIPGHGGFMDRLDGFWAACMLFGGVMLVAEALR